MPPPVPRQSTGGRAPDPNSTARMKTLHCIDEMQSHDGTPMCLAYPTCRADNMMRPRPNIQFYDITPLSDKHIKDTATTLYNDWFGSDNRPEICIPDRLDVYALPMLVGTQEEEQVRRCMEHQRAEIEARKSGPVELQFYPWGQGMNINLWTKSYLNEIYILDTGTPRWEESGMLYVKFDPVQRERHEDDQVPDVWVERICGKAELQRTVNWNRFTLDPEHFFYPVTSDEEAEENE